MTAVLLIDDSPELLESLRARLAADLGAQATVLTWVPVDGEQTEVTFKNYIDNNDVRLVVTDYDLTRRGQLGFFGATVVDWCQMRAIPVGDFSRGNTTSLADEPNLFELRVPVDSEDATVSYISAVFRGFVEIRATIDARAELLRQRSPAAALAMMLDAKRLESQFSQYGARYANANPGLIDALTEVASDAAPPPGDLRKIELLTYITGHLLVNAVLRFPGPIAGKKATCAYLAVGQEEYETIRTLLQAANYSGPFRELDDYLWVHKVDETLEGLEDHVSENEVFQSQGTRRRRALEIALGRTLARSPACTRCHGENGGFLCPFTRRAVCERPDCSTVSNVWIPAGARLCRFEKDFYDEWAPILGM